MSGEHDYEREALERAISDRNEANVRDSKESLRNRAEGCTVLSMPHTDDAVTALRKRAHKIIQREIRAGRNDVEIANRYGFSVTSVREWRDEGSKPSRLASEKIMAREIGS